MNNIYCRSVYSTCVYDIVHMFILNIHIEYYYTVYATRYILTSNTKWEENIGINTRSDLISAGQQGSSVEVLKRDRVIQTNFHVTHTCILTLKGCKLDLKHKSL